MATALAGRGRGCIDTGKGEVIEVSLRAKPSFQCVVQKEEHTVWRKLVNTCSERKLRFVSLGDNSMPLTSCSGDMDCISKYSITICMYPHSVNQVLQAGSKKEELISLHSLHSGTSAKKCFQVISK